MLIFEGEPTKIQVGDIAGTTGYDQLLNITKVFLSRNGKPIVDKRREYHILISNHLAAAHVALHFIADCCGLDLKRREDLDDGALNFFEITAPEEV